MGQAPQVAPELQSQWQLPKWSPKSTFSVEPPACVEAAIPAIHLTSGYKDDGGWSRLFGKAVGPVGTRGLPATGRQAHFPLAPRPARLCCGGLAEQAT